ncbi:MAG TPA: Hsp20 family protein [Rhodobacteraceae bacterium]|nr:Hsp20 family protein [Paracoccaceae bacterium]
MVETTHNPGFWPSLYDPLRGLGSKLAKFLSPASEASQAKDTYRIALELPGVAEDDVEVTVHDGVIAVQGEKRSEREEKGDTWYFSERQYGTFSRSFRLPPDADGARIEASMKDGVLTLVIPKLKPKEPEAKRVKISRG